MKVVIQNGAAHTLSRKQMERIIEQLPPSLTSAVDSVTLYQAQGEEFYVEHYPKARALGLFWPPRHIRQPHPEQVLREFLIGLFIAANRRELPVRLSKSLRSAAEKEIQALLSQCAQGLRRSDA